MTPETAVGVALILVGVGVTETLVGVAVTDTLVGVAVMGVGVAEALVGVGVAVVATRVGVGVAAPPPIWVLVLYEHFLFTPGYGSEPKASVVQAMVLEATYL